MTDAGVSLTFLVPWGQGKLGGGFHMFSIQLLYKFPKYRQGIRPEEKGKIPTSRLLKTPLLTSEKAMSMSNFLLVADIQWIGHAYINGLLLQNMQYKSTIFPYTENGPKCLK